ncbi:hypothetical protein [Ereboglobus luteus]|nr:hypothetical protein [Ereboglobus luteus]
MKYTKIILAIAIISLALVVFFLISIPQNEHKSNGVKETASTEFSNPALPRPAISLKEANTYKCVITNGLAMESGVVRHAMKFERIPPGYRELDMDTYTYRLIIVESGLEYLVASRTVGRGGVAEGSFRFCDYYVLGDYVYYIHRNSHDVYIGASMKTTDGFYKVVSDNFLISEGLYWEFLNDMMFIEPSGSTPLRAQVKCAGYHRIYELKEPGKFELIETNLPKNKRIIPGLGVEIVDD